MKKPKYTCKYIGTIFYYGEGFYVKGFHNETEAAMWMEEKRKDGGQIFKVGKEMDSIVSCVVFEKSPDEYTKEVEYE